MLIWYLLDWWLQQCVNYEIILICKLIWILVSIDHPFPPLSAFAFLLTRQQLGSPFRAQLNRPEPNQIVVVQVSSVDVQIRSGFRLGYFLDTWPKPVQDDTYLQPLKMLCFIVRLALLCTQLLHLRCRYLQRLLCSLLFGAFLKLPAPKLTWIDQPKWKNRN